MKNDVITPTASRSITEITRYIDRIKGLLVDITQATVAISDEFTKLSRSLGGDDKAIDELHAEIPGVGLPFWRSIADVASRKLHPLAISSGCAALAVLKKLDYQEQEKALTVGVPLAT